MHRYWEAHCGGFAVDVELKVSVLSMAEFGFVDK
jgi:hypothetical protein